VESESCAGMMETSFKCRWPFLSLFVAQALGYERNGIIEISFIILIFFHKLKRGESLCGHAQKSKRGESLCGHAQSETKRVNQCMVMPIWLKG
jgi:hypothetical protein